MADAIATTARLMLRAWRADDFAEWNRALNMAAVRGHLGGVYAPDKAKEVFAQLLRGWLDNGHGPLAVVRREDDRLLGSCGFHLIQTECAPDELRGSFEVGYQFREDAWGQGYATEAAGAALSRLFKDIRPERAYGQTSEANRPSWSVMQRLGMTRRVDLDYDDPAYPLEENPTMVWSLTRAEHGAKA